MTNTELEMVSIPKVDYERLKYALGEYFRLISEHNTSVIVNELVAFDRVAKRLTFWGRFFFFIKGKL